MGAGGLMMLGDNEAREVLALDVLSDSRMNDHSTGSDAKAARGRGRRTR